jgi:hypothetical protein
VPSASIAEKIKKLKEEIERIEQANENTGRSNAPAIRLKSL